MSSGFQTSEAVGNHLFFEIPLVLFVSEYKVEIISSAKFLVDIPKCRCQVEATQDKTEGYRLPYISTQVTSINWDYNFHLPCTGVHSRSNFVIVSLSSCFLGGDPVVSWRMIDNSMRLILIRTSKKWICPSMASLRWYLGELWVILGVVCIYKRTGTCHIQSRYAYDLRCRLPS